MKILNLYAGIGGNRKLWGNQHEITAVELNKAVAQAYASLYPNDKVLIEDAHEYLLNHYHEFDFIWSSPPCPTHSKARYGLGFHGGKVEAVYPDMRLYQEILLLKHYFKGFYCVENVIAFYKPLIEPRVLGRHWYWTNFDFTGDVEIAPSRISQESKKYSQSPVKLYKASDYEKLFDINLSLFKGFDKRLSLRNCVEPKVGEHILQAAIKLKTL